MSKKLALLTLMSTLVLSAASAQAQNILSNGSLDAASVSSQALPTPNDWVVDATRTITGVYNDGASSEGFAGPPPTPDTNPGDLGLFFKPFTGNVADGPATVNMVQDNPAVAGLIYTLTGWAGAEANYLSAGSQFAVEFLNGGGAVIGGNVNPLATLLVPNGQAFNYKQYSVSALAPVGTALVRARASMIGGQGNPAGGGQAFVVDDFTLTSSNIPEPSTLALLGLGLLGVGAIRRRK
ncbi:MAG: PEP-CTERM sorting domain-containing protein [Pirellulales bacterium]|nr:PEP-CTERM sorting domain-containing protein [Pirellulales bacterium]